MFRSIIRTFLRISETFLLFFVPQLSLPEKSFGSFGINIFSYKKGSSRSATSLMSDHMGFALQSAAVPITEIRIRHFSSIPIGIDRTRGSSHYFNLFHINARQMIYLYPVLGQRHLKNHYNIGYWFWELATFPDQWQGVSRGLNEIWTSSEFSRQSIQSHSPAKVVVIPPVIDCANQNLEITAKQSGEIFTFLFVFDFSSYVERKNPIAAIQAFRRAFGGDKKVRLHIQCKNANVNLKYFKAMTSLARDLNITISNEDLTLSRTRQLIKSSDVYMSLHRCEGFGFTIAEAMAFRKPVITTSYSGNMDFTNETNSYLVKYKLVPILQTVGPYEKGKLWAEPDVGHAAELMVKVRENYSSALHKASVAERDIREKYNAERIGGMIKNRLTEIYENIRQNSE